MRNLKRIILFLIFAILFASLAFVRELRAGRYGPRLNKSKDRLTGQAILNKCNNGI